MSHDPDYIDETKPLIPKRADPYIYRHTDGYYYFTASVPEYDRIEIRRAWTIGGLADADPFVIWRKHAEGPMSWHIWAPELHFIDGAWYVYFAAGQAGDPWYIRTWVLMNPSRDPLTGTWQEKGQVSTEWDSFNLDLTTFVCRGSRYAVWAQKTRERTENSAIYIARMTTPYTLEFPQVMITRPEYDWECVGFKVNEGASVLMRNGKVFITYSASATDATYCMGLLSADEGSDLLDPAAWKKSETPVFESDETKGTFGPGHNSFTRDFTGKHDILVYHARPYRDVELSHALYDPNRHTWVKKIRWDASGFPVFR